MAGGRPTDYRVEYCDRLIEIMREGASIEEVAADLDISKTTLYNWAEAHEEFMNAKKRGEELSLAWWVKQGRVQLQNRDFSATLFYMNMKNRFKWRDKHDIDHTSGGEPLKPAQVNITAIDPIEAARQYRDIMEKNE
jgi:transposase